MPTTINPTPVAPKRRLGDVLMAWVDGGRAVGSEASGGPKRIDWLRAIPFIGLHLACLAVVAVGVSPVALAVAGALYLVRMFAITGFYHRYFSHKSFKANRFWQFMFAVLGNSAVQKGPLWWASWHRHHHRHSDEPVDAHSPAQHGFWWSHVGWILSREHFATRTRDVPDLARYPELRFLDRFNILVPVLLAGACYGLGAWLEGVRPDWGTSGPQMLVWGFFVSTVVLFHATVTINSLCHVWGRRRYATSDTSRNNFWLALLTLGEGWHNNHHHYPATARQGFRWWQIDITWYGLKLLAMVRVVRDLKPVPQRIVNAPRAEASSG